MINDNVVKCPLCNGFTHIDKPELRKVLCDPRLRKQMEKYVAELLQASSPELVEESSKPPETRDFHKDVRTWNPRLPMWQRNPKK